MLFIFQYVININIIKISNSLDLFTDIFLFILIYIKLLISANRFVDIYEIPVMYKKK